MQAGRASRRMAATRERACKVAHQSIVPVVACFAIFYLATTFALSFGTKTLGYPRETFLAVQLGANTFLALGIAVAGWWADKRSPGMVLGWGAALTALIGLSFGSGLGSGSLPVVFVTLASALFVMGLAYGPLGAWLPTLYAVPVRYTGISLAFNLGGIIGGALAPFAAQLLADRGGTPYVGLFLTAAGAVTLLGVLAGRPVKREVEPYTSALLEP